ncbi:MAG: thioredoxin family protein [Firmicutes bacterium]|nr:thioredoxin family protein [Bacillota bacterium]
MRSGRRRLFVLVAVLVAVAAIVGVRLWMKARAASPDLEEEVRAAFGAGKPVVAVFTYGGDCCEGTRAFFSAYDEAVRAVLGDFQESVTELWVDVARASDDKTRTTVLELAERLGVTQVPSVALVEASGTVAQVFTGPVDAAVLRGALEDLVGGE